MMINMFTEKIFLFIWWWFVLVAVLTCLDLLYWIYAAVVPGSRLSFVKALLNAHGLPRRENEWKLAGFVRKMLRPDGVFVLRLMADNAGEVITSQVVRRLWTEYIEKPESAAAAAAAGNAKPPAYDSHSPPEYNSPPPPPPPRPVARIFDDPDSHFGAAKPTPL